MSRKESVKTFYNRDFKEYFIEQCNKDGIVSSEQAVQYGGLFSKINTIEEKLNKDLCNFTYRELDNLLLGLGYRTVSAARRDISLVNKYVIWCVENGHSNNMQYRVVSGNMTNVERYVYKKLVPLFTREQLYRALDDSAIIFKAMLKCIFEGVGYRDYEEIQLLKLEDLVEVDGEYFVNMQRGIISISSELYKDLVKLNYTLEEEEFKKKYKETDYIFKPYLRKGNENDMFVHKGAKNYLWNELKLSLGNKRIESTSVTSSATNYYAYEEMKKSGSMVLNRDILAKIADRFPRYISRESILIGSILAVLDFDFIRKNYGDFEVAKELEKYIN